MLTFREIEVDDAELLLDWRTSPRVTSMMLTDVEYNKDKQKNWIFRSRQRADFYHWIFQFDGKDIGYAGITLKNQVQKIADSGFYLGRPEFGRIVFPIMQTLHDYIFRFLKQNRLEVTVMEGNIIVHLMEFCGSKRAPERDCTFIKNEKSLTLLGYTLTAEDYLKYRPLKKSVEPFPTSKSIFLSNYI